MYNDTRIEIERLKDMSFDDYMKTGILFTLTGHGAWNISYGGLMLVVRVWLPLESLSYDTLQSWLLIVSYIMASSGFESYCTQSNCMFIR